MNRVFVVVSYEVFDIPGFFKQLNEFVGDLQIEQSIQESVDKMFKIWFYTDKVTIKEGERRQVEIMVKKQDDGKLLFEINKF